MTRHPCPACNGTGRLHLGLVRSKPAKKSDTVAKALSDRTRGISACAPQQRAQQRAKLDPPVCVCGAVREQHRNGKGACAATGCPEWMERGT